jgi:hypothetical protein
MGRSKPWKVALLAVLVAMIVGFARIEHQKKQHPVPALDQSNADDSSAEELCDRWSEGGDPVSQFLIELVRQDLRDGIADEANGLPPTPFPLISELPPLPAAYWPAPHLLSQASSRLARIAAY